MTTLLRLHPVQPADVSVAIDYALEYRGRLPEVWITRDSRNDRLNVMQPTPAGGAPAPGCVEVAQFENTGHNGAGPYFRIVFGPGVLVLTEARSWREKVEDSSDAKAPC